MTSLDLLGAESFGDNMVAAFREANPSLDAVRGGDATLKNGSGGEAVEYVQKRLNVSVDGKFGPKTEAAVKAFQRSKGLPEDGVVNATVMSMLESAPYIIHETAPTTAPTTRATAVTASPGRAVAVSKTESGIKPGNLAALALAGLAVLALGYAVFDRDKK